MEEQTKKLINEFLSLACCRELGFMEICSIMQVQPAAMKTILSLAQNKQYIKEKSKEIGLTIEDEWHIVDQYIKDGFTDDHIAFFLDLPIRQVAFRRHFLEKKLI